MPLRGDSNPGGGGGGGAGGGAQHLQQQDSSSGSSSPHSNTSNDEDILEVTGPPTGFGAGRVHNIYNFSIPDVIKHEPRHHHLVARVRDEPRPAREQRSDCAMNMRNTTVRKRTCAARNNNNNNNNNNNSNNNMNNNNNNSDRNPLEQHAGNNDENNAPVQIVHKKKRRRITAAENMLDHEDDDNDDDADCHLHHRPSVIVDDDDADCHSHHHRPPVIDLTNIDSHDDFSNVHSDSEVHDSSHIETRPLHHHTPRPPSINEVLSNLQRFRQQLDSQERAHLLRASQSRIHRLRRRRNSRAIVTDGPQVTDDMLVQDGAEPTIDAPEMTSADDSVMVINEVRGDGNVYMDDHDIALRMATDPTYSPPYAPPNTDHYRGHYRHSRTDESFHQFQERIRCIRQRSRDRFEQVRRISQQAQERLARLHESITSLRPARRLADGESEGPTTGDGGATDVVTGGVEGNNSDTENIEVFDDIEDDDENDDVEITRESIPPNTDPLHHFMDTPYDLQTLGHLPMAVRSPHGVRDGTTQLNVGALPDFLRTSLMSTLNPPRLSHHIHDIPGAYEDLWNLAERLGPAKPRGLNKHEIEQIPSFRFSERVQKETNRKCVVCMGEYNNREKLRRLPCSHDFHSKCIDKWLKSNKTCPVCRDEVKAENNKPYTP